LGAVPGAGCAARAGVPVLAVFVAAWRLVGEVAAVWFEADDEAHRCHPFGSVSCLVGRLVDASYVAAVFAHLVAEFREVPVRAVTAPAVVERVHHITLSAE